jgi:hypothetical protein
MKVCLMRRESCDFLREAQAIVDLFKAVPISGLYVPSAESIELSFVR